MKKSCSILVLIAILVSCSSQPIPDTKESLKPTKEIISKPSESPDITPKFLLTAENIEKVVNSKLVQSNNSFGTKLFLNIAKENLKNNVFISPISASIALQMLYNGADGKTKEEMSRILEIDKFSLDELNSLNRILSTKLSNPAEDITLNVANSVWANSKQTEFIPEFSKNLKTFYNSESKDIDFSSNGSSEIVNQWCSDKTNKKIEKIFEKGALEKSPPMSILINAIYFKADWQRKFKKEDTQLLKRI